jgi:hypothetical protein
MLAHFHRVSRARFAHDQVARFQRFNPAALSRSLPKPATAKLTPSRHWSRWRLNLSSSLKADILAVVGRTLSGLTKFGEV